MCPTTEINIIFDGPPSHESGRFVEVEDENGHGINVGEWVKRPDGYWALVLHIAVEEESPKKEWIITRRFSEKPVGATYGTFGGPYQHVNLTDADVKEVE